MSESIHDRYDWRADVRARLEGAGLAPADQADMVEEIAQHLEQQFAELALRIGALAARDRLLAQLRDDEFEKAVAGKRRREQRTRARVWSSSSLLRDVRQGVRSLRRTPATLVAGSAALALGIGLTATMFSIIYGLLIKGLPFDQPARIAVVKLIDPRQPGVDAPVSLGDYGQYRAQQRSFETLAAYSTMTVNVSGGDRADRVEAALVTAGVLETPRVQPALGRMFGAADVDPAAPPTAILGQALWRDRFASSPDVIGKTLRVNGRPHTIVGVMPPNYEFPYNTRLWLPIQENLAALPPGQGENVLLIGRLRSDATYDNANAEFSGLTQRLAALRPAADSNLHMAVLPFVRASINPRVYTLLYGMLGPYFLFCSLPAQTWPICYSTARRIGRARSAFAPRSAHRGWPSCVSRSWNRAFSRSLPRSPVSRSPSLGPCCSIEPSLVAHRRLSSGWTSVCIRRWCCSSSSSRWGQASCPDSLRRSSRLVSTSMPFSRMNHTPRRRSAPVV
jgi:hypothetical protein